MIDFTEHQLEKYHNHILEEFGITTKQSKVLGYLYTYRDQDVLQKNIEEKFSLRSSTVTSVMRNLEKAGFIERYQSKNDARVKRIVITAKGYEVHGKVRETFGQLEEFLLKGFTEEEKASFSYLLEKGIQNVKDYKNP